MIGRAALAVLALPWGAAATAQSVPPGCDANLVLQARNASLAQRYAPRGLYCDGRVIVPSSGSFPLLSVIAGSHPATRGASSGPIRLSLPQTLVGTVGSARLQVHGQELTRGGSWRLDGQMAAAGLTIDRSPALGPMGLDATKIGLVATILPERGVVVPLVVSGFPGDGVSIITRAPAPLRFVRLEVRGQGQADYSRIVAQSVPGGRVLRIPLPEQSFTATREVRVVASGAGTDRYTLTLRILLPRAQ